MTNQFISSSTIVYYSIRTVMYRIMCLLLGAAAMYEAAHRTGIEVGGDSTDLVVQYCKQRDYYATSLCCLKLCSHDYQWLVRPATSDKG